MGNQQSEPDAKKKKSVVAKKHPSSVQPVNPSEKPYALLLPIEKLTKRLEEISEKEEGIKGGITYNVFQSRVLSEYPGLATRIYHLLQRVSHCGGEGSSLPAASFLQVSEQLMAVMSDERQTELYLKMYAEAPYTDLSRERFYELAEQCHLVALDHYPEGPRCCTRTKTILTALTDAAFHGKQQVPLSYMVHWVQEHCPRLLLGLHRYVVHHLNTSYRSIDQMAVNTPQQESDTEKERAEEDEKSMDLGTPVLEREINFSSIRDEEFPPLPLSQVWLLAVSLPKLYVQPSTIQSPSSHSSGLNSLDSQGLIARWLGTICPSHWTPLYNSNLHGLGANRFLTHVLSYRGPTLTFVRGEGGVEFCIGSTDEWHETHQYWGQEECILLQTLPLFHVIEKGPKLLYLNTSIRGYPQGLRAGQDPRKPGLSVNDGFSVVEYKGIPYPLTSVEVWGCGTSHSREAQLDIKKWQVKQAERHRQVKLSAVDWVDHPDRYLLELGGRTTYNNDCK